MKCRYCGEEVSDQVMKFHYRRCDGRSPEEVEKKKKIKKKGSEGDGTREQSKK